MTKSKPPLPTKEQIADLTDQLRKALVGKGPMLQGAVLADIVSIFFAAHNPEIRQMVMLNWMNMVMKLIKLNEKKIIESGGWKKPN